MKPLEFDIIELAFMAGLSSFKSLNNKARKQNWPYIRQQKASGSPVHLYPLSGLPDELQIAWAQWDGEKRTQCIALEQEKQDKGKPERVPELVRLEQAQEAFKLNNRFTYYQVPSKDYQTEQASRRVYDGKSRGLCQAAREVLIERFEQLNPTAPIAAPLLLGESERTWGQPQSHSYRYPKDTGGYPGNSLQNSEIDPPPILTFDPHWIRQVFHTAPQSMALLDLLGDSMAPTLIPGDLVLVDQSQQQIKDGLLYAFGVGDDFLVKRVQLQVDGSYKLQCDNPKYAEQIYNPKDPTISPTVIGQVVWFGREL